MSINSKKILAILCISTFIFSCGGNKNEDIDSLDMDTENNSGIDSQKISAQNVFNAVPSRNIILDIVQKSNAEYNPSLLNDPENANKYNLESAKALNLGIYGSDLNATNVFDQTQESMLFLKCVNILAKSIGVSNAFDEQMVNRMEANKQNRDSTLEVISGAFKKADKILKDNGRPGTSSLIVAGAWIEGMYLAINTANDTKYDAMAIEILKQKESLGYLIELLIVSKISDDSNYVLDDLKSLQSEFDSVSDAKITIASLKSIDAKITALRNKVILPN